MAKAKEATSTTSTRARKPEVRAGNCPRNVNHTATRVYRTVGKIRYCKCNDCGETWKQTADDGDPLSAYLAELADSLEAAERVDTPNGKVITLADADARSICDTLRDFVTTP